MIRVSGTSGAASPKGVRKAKDSSGAFRIDGPRTAGSTASAAPAAPAETLSALIALQSGLAGNGGRAKKLVAAQRVLELLDKLRLSLLEGDATAADLDVLSLAASVRNEDMDTDPGLDALIEEISLRAQVELAKRGR